ncbi:MAG: metalloregulator ArsR/SmtB family transcription factor [Deltaproteobacteria bacterium]|nr:metalloregulator ArsR/SmtB family transcription factor [Deltaproteobacteria bacterium]
MLRLANYETCRKKSAKDAAIFEIMAVTKALADESRVRLLAALSGGELCACQLIELIGLAPSTVSKHLSILRTARLIEYRKKGRWMYYRHGPDAQAPVAVKTSLDWLLETVRDQRNRILEDRRRLEQILKIDSRGLVSAAGAGRNRGRRAAGELSTGRRDARR